MHVKEEEGLPLPLFARSHLVRNMAPGRLVDDLNDRVKDRQAEHTCLHKFEEFSHCMTPGRQLGMYYREGRHESCPWYLFRFTACLESKVPSLKQRVERREVERRRSLPGKHVWTFRRQYAEEAHARYGVRPERRGVAGASPLTALADSLMAQPAGSAPAAKS